MRYADPLAQAEIDRLRALVAETAEEALEDVEHWASYAGDYFRDKWHLDEDIARYRALVAEYRAAPEADQ